MTISFYLIISIILILALLLVKCIGQRNKLNYRGDSMRWWFYLVLCLLGVVSMLTVRRYMYPKDDQIFKNADYHLLEHRGFVSDSVFVLVDNQSPKSLWDSKTGSIVLRHGEVSVSGYSEPFYSADSDDKSFILRNSLYDADVSKKIFLEYDGDVILDLSIEPYKDEDGIQRCRYSVKDRDSVYISTFNKLIRKGYPLCDILASTPGYVYTAELNNILQGTLLVRESIEIDKWHLGSEKSVPEIKGIALRLMPGAAWYEMYPSVRVNGTDMSVNDSCRPAIAYNGKMLFYSGVGRTKTDVYALSLNADGRLELRYAVSKKYYFSTDRERVFITSSVDGVLESAEDGGYYYNIFDNEDNEFHVNAQMRYSLGNSREELVAEVIDMFSDDPSVKSQVKAGDEFRLSTSLGQSNQWIFGVRDLRGSNDLDWNYIIIILSLFLLFVLIRIYVDLHFCTHSLSYLEFAVYVVLICLATIRLIISWRVSTFVPVEDITGPVLAKMLTSTKGWTEAIVLYPVVLTIISVIRGIWQKKHPDGVEDKSGSRGALMAFIEDIKPWKIPVYFTLSLIACAVGGNVIPQFDRLLNIPLPLILYMLFDLWIVVRETSKKEQDFDFIEFRIIDSLIISGYLFLADAGFIVIFVVYLVLLHCVIGPLTDGVEYLKRKPYLKYGLSIGSIMGLFILLKYEGDVMIWLFDNISWMSYLIWIPVAIFLIVFAYLLARKYWTRVMSVDKKWLRYLVLAAYFIVVPGILYVSYDMCCHSLPEKIAGKDHMKWRAEVQRLEENENIDKLMQECEFNSSDITFIMRSAHNQWFINQYYNEGEEHQKYFELQSHSDQGSTYTTQTTDLAITRYVIAEHGYWPPRFMLILFLLLILIYCFEVRFGDSDGKQDRILLGALVLLFTLSLMVYLSATNRIVFIGQDFPFMSIQSRVAVVFPVLLMLLATLPVLKDRMESERRGDNGMVNEQKRLIPVLLLIFYILTVGALKPLGQNQDANQFNVSDILKNISNKVSLIDRDLVRCQLDSIAADMNKDELWEYFKSSNKAQNYNKFQNDTTDVFFQSLLKYFDLEQLDKDDPEELLHMRRRNGIWHLTVNMRHYFIPSKKKNAESWEGHVLAAKLHRDYALSDIKGNNDCPLDTNSIQKYVMPKSVSRSLPGMILMKFSKEWTDDELPLVLVSSMQGKSSKQFFQIESGQGTILAKDENSSPRNQVATRVLMGDVLVLNAQNKSGKAEVATWNFGMEDDRYFAKNVWLNGKRKLFYPMGKEFIWSYQFANMVNSVYGADDKLRDSSIRLSLDYDLHQKMQKEMDRLNKPQVRGLKPVEVESLRKFAELGEDMFNSKNKSGFYCDGNVVKPKDGNAVSVSVRKALDKINDRISTQINDDPDNADNEAMIADAVYEVTGYRYQFSAVAINGDGKIRLMFDHGKSRMVDPNNVSHFNRYISELYRAGDNSSERDIFGNKALQILPSGPGSSFKPIAYTSITSAQKMHWENLDVRAGSEKKLAEHTVTEEELKENPNALNNKTYDWYGGVEMKSIGEGPLAIDGNLGLNNDNYLIKSNNLYHSVMIMLGLQKKGTLHEVMMPATAGAKAFPIFTYNGQNMSFNPDVWYNDGNIDMEHGVLNDGLENNFNLYQGMTGMSSEAPIHTNYFGTNGGFAELFDNAGSYKNWVYPESGSMNVTDRQEPPIVRNGFNQMLLGASPLEVSPLQMATMAMRLASLNREKSITTLSDDPSIKPDYKFFTIDNSWGGEQEFFEFYQRQVLNQLRRVPRYDRNREFRGTASALNQSVLRWENAGYYIYAKTGTLNDGRIGKSSDSRIKHLMVIISDTELESPSLKWKDLQDVKYYVLYLSYIGISEGEFETSNYAPMISAVIESELFKQYMGE